MTTTTAANMSANMAVTEPSSMIRPRRQITGISATLLPYTAGGDVDWASFDDHLERTVEAGLTPAVNMDTGYVNLLDDETRLTVLEHTQAITGGAFVAGAFVADHRDASWNADAYLPQIEQIQEHEGTPIIFQCYSLTNQSSDEIVSAYAELGRYCDRYYAFELGKMFAPFGQIYDLQTYAGLLKIPQCIGAKHSSLSRTLEWERLALRDEERPDFQILTGNDLAIDMVIYGSDYLLGLSTFAPDLFAKRDALWAAGDPRFYELNDLLQYLGFFAFRAPVPAYKHSAAQFLALRGRIGSSEPHPDSPRRDERDTAILGDILERLSEWENA